MRFIVLNFYNMKELLTILFINLQLINTCANCNSQTRVFVEQIECYVEHLEVMKNCLQVYNPISSYYARKFSIMRPRDYPTLYNRI